MKEYPVSERLPDPERSSGKVIWENAEFELMLRGAADGRAATPFAEGTHLQVRSKGPESRDWQTMDTRTLLNEAALSIWPARVLAEFGQTEDAWTNQHFDPKYPEGINLYGRKPLNERSWGQRGAQPVIKTGSGFAVPQNRALQETLAPFLERTMPTWESAVENITLFERGVNSCDPASAAFKQRAEAYRSKAFPYEETLLWANDKFDLVSIDRPHLNGIHLVVYPAEHYWADKGRFLKPWQLEKTPLGHQPKLEYQQAFLESLAIARVAEQVIMSDPEFAQQFENPELHSSGNWAADLQYIEHGGKFDQVTYGATQTVAERTRLLHRFKPTTSYHMHVYIPKQGYVALPSRPAGEAPDEWSHIESLMQPEQGTPASQWKRHTAEYHDRVSRMCSLLQTGDMLTRRVHTEASGALFSAN